MTVQSTIILQILLILVNAFFAGTEIAVISLNTIQLKKEAEDGDKKAKKLLYMVENQSGFLSTIQIGITLAGFLGAAFSADVLSEHLVMWLKSIGCPGSVSLLNTLAVICITVVISLFTLIFGELVPKRIAQQKSEQWARKTIGFISGLAVFFRPMVALLSFCTNLILKFVSHKRLVNNSDDSAAHINQYATGLCTSDNIGGNQFVVSVHNAYRIAGRSNHSKSNGILISHRISDSHYHFPWLTVYIGA